MLKGDHHQGCRPNDTDHPTVPGPSPVASETQTRIEAESVRYEGWTGVLGDGDPELGYSGCVMNYVHRRICIRGLAFVHSDGYRTESE